MSGGKRYFTPQCGPPNKRKSQQPYFVDKRLTPRVNEYLNSYGQENKSDVDGIVDYLQMSFPEYGRKKRLSLRQSVVKVLSSSPKPTPDKKVKLQKQLQDGDRASDNSSFSSEEEELIEAKNTNMINNSMHNLYARVNKDLMSKSICEDSVKVDGENEITNTLVTEQACKVVNSSIAESQNEILDKVKSYDMSTPVPSPGGSKSGKSDDERSKRNQSKRRRNRENEDGKVASGKHSIKPTESTLKLSDVGGYENALEEVMKLLFHLKHPEVFQRLGVKPPRGFLLHGPPGCGKTLLANAIAGELQLPYFKLAATEVISGVSGESEEKLRELFVAAQQASPSIIFIDEIDAIAPNRESASKEMERRIVSQLLVCMDDLDGGDSDVLLIGATNRPDSLDPALRRAGRFDREICLGIPDHAARKRIFGVVCGGLRLADNFDYDEIASLTPGFVGADLVSLMREAAMFAVQRIFQNIEEKTAASQLTEESQNSEETPIEESIKGNETAAPEAKFKALSWVKDRPPLPTEELDRFFIEMEDFKQALTTVQPSAKREGFATVPDVTWKDIGALEDIRDELSLAILAPVRHYEQFKSLGIANPPGILLAGPPGCGKTLLAKAIANEAGINFISVKGPELLNMYVGESERAVRQVFQRARNSAPCVIFFDEIDALCPKRSEMGESSASSRVVNQLLTEMDGLVVRKQVFLMGATNRPDIIDPAILRPGRLDKILFVGLPEPEDRVKILRTVTKCGTQPRLAEDVDLEQISRDARCERYSGADLAALVREASVQILKDFMRNDAQIKHGNTGLVVTMQHFEQAFTKLRPSVSLESKNWYDKLRAKFGIQ